MLTIIFGILKAYLGLGQLIHPYAMPFHDSLEGRLSTPMICILELMAAVSFFGLALFFKPNGYAWGWKVAVGALALPVVFVTGAVFVYPLEGLFFRSLFVLWFIGMPVFLTLALRYLDGNIKDSEKAITRLYGLTYPYKKA